jgi:predicted kinase
VGTSALSGLIRDAQRLLESLGPLPEAGGRPVFIALSGLPGTGKSYFSQKLAQRLPLAILGSDALRKALFPHPNYSWRESARLFQACYYLIEELLRKSISLVLDATNLSERYRRQLYHIAERVGVKFILIRVDAPVKIVKQRLESRAKDNISSSDADWAVYQYMKTRMDKIRHPHRVLNTTQDISTVLDWIVQQVKKERSSHGNSG